MTSFKGFPPIIIFIFVVGVIVRMLYFPGNIHFAFDQARDAFTAQEILKGDFKIIGPPSAASDKLFPGPLTYYFSAPFYFLFGKSPEVISIVLRIWNSFGILLIFLIGKTLFNKSVGIFSALLFAFSYEQTQYSLFISHQPLAVVPVLLFYLGLSWLIFAKKPKGLILALLGWGLAIQFHYVYFLLLIILATNFLIFRKSFIRTLTMTFSPRLKRGVSPLKENDVSESNSSADLESTVFLGSVIKHILISLTIFLISISTYILAELKFNFRFLSFVVEKFTETKSGLGTLFYSNETLFVINRFIHDTIIANYNLTPLVALILAGTVFYLMRKKELKPKIFFLLIWFFGGLTPYLLSGTPSYYYGAGLSTSLLIFISWVILQFLPKQPIIQFSVFLLIIFNNLGLIISINPYGLNRDVVIQPGMTLANEKAALDYIYSNTNSQPFAVGALTIPLSINTTWSYLFEWYGKEKYNFLPVWGGETAEGYYGNLKVIRERSKLPENQFLIIEPTVGIKETYKQKFLEEENYFTKTVEEKSFGTITVQRRTKI